MSDTEEYEVWFEIEPSYPSFQHKMWRNSENGTVLVVEHKEEPWQEDPVFNVLLLPQDFEQDTSPLQEVATDCDNLEEALQAANDYKNAT